MALRDVIQEQIYIRQILDEIAIFNGLEPVKTIYTDSASAMDLSSNPEHHSRTKYVDIRYYFTREKVREGSTKLIFCPIKKQLADALTKPVDYTKLDFFRQSIGLVRRS